MSADTQAIPDHTWFKSSYSGGNATECVEAALDPTCVLVRDSKHPEGPHLAVSERAWVNFMAGMQYQ
ncbi:DUF397 domain-containing protein [Streptomyces sp. NPDC048504]|uniref:DUF397 domain-containing protein n=1 Tax=Streptomyces sp. NPDC048504 TaxID=3365559 RepID=UPI00371BC4A0